MDEDLDLETPGFRRKGIVELPDSEPQRVDRNSAESPDIPILEEVEGAAYGTMVAEAPSVAVNRVATYRELDSQLMKHAAFATLEDIGKSQKSWWREYVIVIYNVAMAYAPPQSGFLAPLLYNLP